MDTLNTVLIFKRLQDYIAKRCGEVEANYTKLNGAEIDAILNHMEAVARERTKHERDSKELLVRLSKSSEYRLTKDELKTLARTLQESA